MLHLEKTLNKIAGQREKQIAFQLPLVSSIPSSEGAP